MTAQTNVVRLREGFALAKELLSGIENAEIRPDTQNFDLYAVAADIERAVTVADPNVRRGVFLALADWLTARTETSIGAESWTPCAAGSKSLLLQLVRRQAGD